ncbi:MAG: M1 family metallopeptidase [Gemmatimonadetes bacterium]|nr:M1 family metallopeptidase [Gemmatimonadota bacterium]
MATIRRGSGVLAALLTAVLPLAAAAQQLPERAVRRDIPLTNTIRRAFAAGTRDSTGRPGPKYWQTAVDYRIEARLEIPGARIAARQSAVVHNQSPDPMRVIVLRLDQNIFRADAVRLTRPPEITDGFRFTRLAVNGQPLELTGPPRPGSNSVFGLDQTVATIQLANPIAPGASATLDLGWRFRVPHPPGSRGLRHGALGDTLVQVAQWYPRVAVFDDLRGWDTEPYLGASEFYHNFGSFDVSLDVPAGWIVGATGVLQNPEQVLTAAAQQRLQQVPGTDDVVTVVGAEARGPGIATAAGERLVWRFRADSVADFAWGASPVYVWQATRVQAPGGRTIPMHIYFMRDRASAFAQVPAVGRHAVEFYSRLWLPYAFPQLTVLDGPELGMEYPMLVMSGLGALDHEIGHEWWPMMVGVNETWYGFMDEGFNSYMNILSGADRAQRPPRLDSLGMRYGQTSGNEQEAPLMWNANYGGPMYRFQAYQKAPLLLSSLGGIVGDTAVWQAMSAYARAWQFKHPSPWDFAFFMNRALGRDLSWFWYYWLFTTESSDGSIRSVTTSENRTTVTIQQAGQMPAPVVLRVDFAADGPAIRTPANGRLLDATSALVMYPVDVWFNGSRSFDAVLDFGGRKIERITYDPFGRFPDRDPKDNVWPR